MKENILFVNPSKCSGCLLCEMICSFEHDGNYGRKNSCIKILIHPTLNNSIPFLSNECNCPDGKERCVSFCITEAIQFISPERLASFIRNQGKEWIPCPIA
jgi:carbon-monoxide dehydrogenase iron sulfur subunit